MKAFWSAVIVAMVVAVGAWQVLETQQKNADVQYATDGVSLGGYGKK